MDMVARRLRGTGLPVARRMILSCASTVAEFGYSGSTNQFPRFE